MKVALLLTGHIRSYRHNFQSLNRILFQNYEVDVYCCTWNKTQNYLGEDLVDIDPNFHLIYGSNLKNCLILDTDEYTKSKPHLTIGESLNTESLLGGIDGYRERIKTGWHERLFDQWYLINQCWNSVKNPESYDKIVRLRYDIWLANMTIREYPNFVVPRDIGGWSFTDHFAYGNYHSMKKYCNMVTHIQKMYNDYGIDVTHAVDMPKFYMTSYEESIPFLVDHSISYGIYK